jgi:hypothetical protein
MIASAPRAGPTRSYLKDGDRKAAAGNLARHRPVRKRPEEPMNWKIVLAASIALGFLDFGELSVVQEAVAGDTVALSAATKKKRPPRAGRSRTRSRAPSSDAIPFLPVATPKWATTGMESRPASLSVSRRESAKIWGEFPPLSGVKSGKDVPPDDQSRSSHPDRPVACRSP